MRKMSEKGFVAIKVDLEKAYDRVSWEFIREVLMEINLDINLPELIMKCITTTTLNVLWNGNRTGEFCPARGVRQGDPLSPYVFILCMDKLSHIISDTVEKKLWNPMRVGTNGPAISHLMFADDLLLLGEASMDQIDTIL